MIRAKIWVIIHSFRSIELWYNCVAILAIASLSPSAVFPSSHCSVPVKETSQKSETDLV